MLRKRLRISRSVHAFQMTHVIIIRIGMQYFTSARVNAMRCRNCFTIYFINNGKPFKKGARALCGI